MIVTTVAAISLSRLHCHSTPSIEFYRIIKDYKISSIHKAMTPHTLDSSIPALGISRTLTATTFKSRLKWAQSWRRNFFFSLAEAMFHFFLFSFFLLVYCKHTCCLFTVGKLFIKIFKLIYFFYKMCRIFKFNDENKLLFVPFLKYFLYLIVLTFCFACDPMYILKCFKRN